MGRALRVKAEPLRGRFASLDTQRFPAPFCAYAAGVPCVGGCGSRMAKQRGQTQQNNTSRSGSARIETLPSRPQQGHGTEASSRPAASCLLKESCSIVFHLPSRASNIEGRLNRRKQRRDLLQHQRITDSEGHALADAGGLNPGSDDGLRDHDQLTHNAGGRSQPTTSSDSHRRFGRAPMRSQASSSSSSRELANNRSLCGWNPWATS